MIFFKGYLYSTCNEPFEYNCNFTEILYNNWKLIRYILELTVHAPGDFYDCGDLCLCTYVPICIR